MTETQEKLLKLLKEVDYICRKYGIKYYLAGGSLVGAVRHGGFLPWDDDADIHMPIEDAERFACAVEEEAENLPGRREVFSKSEACDCMNTHWRYFDLDSTLLMRGMTGSTSPQGQFVDIFVMYPLPVDEEKKQKCLDSFELYVELKAQNTAVDSRRSIPYLQDYYEAKKKEKQLGTKQFLEKMEDEMFHFPQEEATEWFICAPFPDKRVVPKDWWGNPRYIKFEDTELPVAEKAEKLLSYSYGPAWFEVPDHIDRGSHVFVLDFDIPYTVYTDEYNKYLNIKEFYDSEVRKKEFWFDLLSTRNVLNPHIRGLQGMCKSLEIQEFVEQHEIDLAEWVEQRREKELASLFAPYFEALDSTKTRYWKLYIDMPDEYLFAALCFDCFNGNYGRPRKILAGRREIQERPLSPDLKRLCALCDAIDELLTALYGDLDDERARELCDEWIKKEPQAVHFMRADILLRLKNANTEEAAETLEKCEKYLVDYENDGELLKYKGDLLISLGEISEGEFCYKKAQSTLKNGYCMTEIKKYFLMNEGKKEDDEATADTIM